MAKDMQSVRFNEQVKRFSTVSGNGALALFIAALARWWTMGVELYAVLWLLLSIGIMFGSLSINSMLQPEDE